MRAASPEIIARAVAGDSAAFGVIYEVYSDFVFRFILRRTHHTPLSEDLTADTFLKALRFIHRFEWQGTDIAAWLLTIARSQIADHYRAKRNTEIPVNWAHDTKIGETPDQSIEGRPEETVTDHVAARHVMAAINNLMPKQRDVLICRFVHDLSQLETANVLGLTESQVKALQFRAVRAMARQFPEGRQR